MIARYVAAQALAEADLLIENPISAIGAGFRFAASRVAGAVTAKPAGG